MNSGQASTLQPLVPTTPESSQPSSSVQLRYARFGGFDLDLHQQELFKDGARVKLQGKVSEVLLILLQSPGEVVTREALRTRLWPHDAQVNYDANVNTTVNKLRQMLGDTPEKPLYVETIPRKGYSFVGKVEFAEQPGARLASEVDSAAAAESAAMPRDHWFSALRGAPPRSWLAAAALLLVVAGMLFGSALVLYAHRVHAKTSEISVAHPDSLRPDTHK